MLITFKKPVIRSIGMPGVLAVGLMSPRWPVLTPNRGLNSM